MDLDEHEEAVVDALHAFTGLKSATQSSFVEACTALDAARVLYAETCRATAMARQERPPNPKCGPLQQLLRGGWYTSSLGASRRLRASAVLSLENHVYRQQYFAELAMAEAAVAMACRPAGTAAPAESSVTGADAPVAPPSSVAGADAPAAPPAGRFCHVSILNFFRFDFPCFVILRQSMNEHTHFFLSLYDAVLPRESYDCPLLVACRPL